MARPAPPATQRCWRPTGDAARWHSNRAARTETTKQLKGQRLVSRLAPVQTIQAEQPFPLEYCLECIGGPPGGGRHDRHLGHEHAHERRMRSMVAHQQLIGRSEEHTSELQSRENLVCRLLLEKKNPT